VGCTVFTAGTTLVEHWAGNHWSILKSPNPTGFEYHDLDGVSCPGTTSCYAVGSYTVGGVGKSLVEYWNGNADDNFEHGLAATATTP